MILVKVVNGEVDKFPYTLENLRSDNASVSFPANPSENILNAYGAYVVTFLPYPTYDDRLYRIVKDEQPTKVDGVWTMSYNLIPKTDEEIKAYDTAAYNDLKTKLYDAIDSKTNYLITYGFVYLTDIRVRMTLEDQQNFEGMYNMIKDYIEIGMPESNFFPVKFKVWTDDNGAPLYYITHNLSEMRNFIAAGKMFIGSCLAEGWALKENLVKLSLDELKVWKDPRDQ